MAESLSEKQWYVLRDLSRRNANVMAHDILSEAGLEVFTPMMEMLMVIRGKKQRRVVPVVQDLLFVHEQKAILDDYVTKHPNIQYRYQLGHSISDPMTVRGEEMQRFMVAINSTERPKYFTPEELTKNMYGRNVKIVGGPLNGFEGRLLSVKGMRTKRLLVQIPNLISAAVEVNPEFITFI